MTYELQRNFSAGEISPKMWLRNDLGPIYQNSVKLMRNMIPEPWGPTSSRFGFDFIEYLPGEINGKLFDFNLNFSESFVIACCETLIYVIDRTGFTLEANIIQNPNFGLGGADWDSRGNVTFAGGTAILNPNGGNLASIRQNLPMEAGETYFIRIFTLDLQDYNIIGGLLEGGNDQFDINVVGTNEFVFEYVPPSTQVWLEIVNPAGNQPDVFVDVVQCQKKSAGGVTFDSPWNDELTISGLQSALTPNSDTMYFTSRGVDVHKMTRAEDGLWTFEPVVFDFGANPDPWEAPNQPGCIEFHQGRLYLANTFEEPISIWGSVAGDFENFDFGDPQAQTPGDAVFLPLDKHGEIQWLRSNKVLFAGLDTGEHVIFGFNGPIDVDNAQTEQHSKYGSARIQAIVVNEQVMYVDTAGRDVRLVDYERRNNSWVSTQMSFIAEHITSGFIFDAAFGSSPFGIVWFATLSGDLITMCVEKDAGTVGWARHETQGNVISVATLKESGRDVPWILVKRNQFMYVERYSDILPIGYLDSAELGLADDPEVPQTVYEGFDHLNGFTCGVVADGAVHPDVVVEDGVITLQYPAAVINVGLRFKRTIRTHPKVDERMTGNTFIHFKRWAEIVVAILGSARPIINGVDTYGRNPATPMDTREPDRTEYVSTTELGYSYEGEILIEDDSPLPLTIVGIGGKLSEDAL